MPTLSPKACVLRRDRLAELLVRETIDLGLITDVRDIYYFTGVLLPDDLPAGLVLSADGATWLSCPDGYDAPAVDNVEWYSWNHRGTRHPDPVERIAKSFDDAHRRFAGKRIGVQAHSILYRLAQQLHEAGASEIVSIDEPISAMQRRKDPDEVVMIRESIRANLAAYSAVAENIAPGVIELDVLSAGRRGATRAAGEKVFHDGDYQCGTYNGPARNRPIERGDLYIVDAWTCYRGYWSDMSRTFAVGVEPSETQQSLYEHICRLQKQIPDLLRPGIDGRDVFSALDQMIRQHPPLANEGLIHHGGHAIGLRSHEMPDINLERGGKLEPGNVVCVEPGGYFAAARFGVRLENMYLITEKGCEDLCPGEISLTVCR
jgi:Xaa-Pro aminopeptidase